jgi:hypothetical protein
MKKGKEEKNIVEIQEEVKIGDVILEKGDKIEVLQEKKALKENLINSLVNMIEREFGSGADPSMVGEALGIALADVRDNLFPYDEDGFFTESLISGLSEY